MRHLLTRCSGRRREVGSVRSPSTGPCFPPTRTLGSGEAWMEPGRESPALRLTCLQAGSAWRMAFPQRKHAGLAGLLWGSLCSGQWLGLFLMVKVCRSWPPKSSLPRLWSQSGHQPSGRVSLPSFLLGDFWNILFVSSNGAQALLHPLP